MFNEQLGTSGGVIESSTSLLERRLQILFGPNSLAFRALDLVMEEMCAENGFHRDNGTDYYNHCVEVANTLITYEFKDENTICAALLHDIVEDVEGYTIETIKKLFNERVAQLVMYLTKKEGIDYSKQENLNTYLGEIMKDPIAAAIKTSDRMHNMMTLQQKTYEARYNKAMETKIYYLPFFKKCGKLFPRYENLFEGARAQIEPLIFHIESFYGEIVRQQEIIDELKNKLESFEN